MDPERRAGEADRLAAAVDRAGDAGDPARERAEVAHLPVPPGEAPGCTASSAGRARGTRYRTTWPRTLLRWRPRTHRRASRATSISRRRRTPPRSRRSVVRPGDGAEQFAPEADRLGDERPRSEVGDPRRRPRRRRRRGTRRCQRKQDRHEREQDGRRLGSPSCSGHGDPSPSRRRPRRRARGPTRGRVHDGPHTRRGRPVCITPTAIARDRNQQRAAPAAGGRGRRP
jgi:hypothetical protein